MNPEELRKWMDACQSEEDLELDEMAPLAEHLREHPEDRAVFERIQKADRAIRPAFRDVPVPEGLAERIQARLQSEPPTPAGPQDRPRAIPFVFWPVAGTALALLVGLSLVFMSGPTDPQTERDAVVQIEAMWNNQDLSELDTGKPPLPLPREINGRFVEGWHQIDDEYTVFRLGGPGVKAQGALFVRKLYGNPPLPTSPSTRGESLSGNKWGTAWKEGKLLYVLVVKNADHRDRVNSFLKKSAPVTIALAEHSLFLSARPLPY